MRAWDQALWVDVMLSSGFVAFFGSAPAEPFFRSLIAARNASAFLIFLSRSHSFVRPRRRHSSAPTADLPGHRAQRRSMTAPLWGRPEGLSLTAASTVAGLVVAGLGSVRGSMAPRRLADRCRCQVHRSLRGPAALAAPWPQGFDAAMSRTRSARLAQEESRGRRGPSRQGQLPLLQQRTSFN